MLKNKNGEASAAMPEKPAALSPDLVKQSLARIVATADFAAAERARRFLEFVVLETLAGRADQLKAFNIALEVFDRDEDFDPQSNPLVRVEAGKLRRRLQHYYFTEGKDDPLEIDIPKGGYVPKFSLRELTAAESLEEAPVATSFSAAPSSPGPKRGYSASLRKFVTPLASLGLLAAVAAGWALSGLWQERDGGDGVVSGGNPVILIMPFETDSGDTTLARIARGVSREVLNVLVQSDQLIVIDGSLSRPNDSISDLVRRTNADYVLYGQLRRFGETMRITSRLINEKGVALWSRTLENSLSVQDLFVIEDTIAKGVAEAIAQPYGIVFQNISRRMRSAPPESLSAYECVLRAYEYRLGFKPEDHRAVRDCLEAVIEAEPNYAEAFAMLSLVYLDEFRFAYNVRNKREDGLKHALELAQRSVALAPDSATALRALLYTRFAAGETELALEAGEKALSLNPNNFDVKAIVGFRKAVSGQWAEGIALLNEAIASAPLHPSGYYFAIVLDEYRQGRYAEALETMTRIELDNFFWTHAHYAMIYAELGQLDKARAALARTLELMPEFAAQPREIIGTEIRDGGLIDDMLSSLRKAGLTTEDD